MLLLLACLAVSLPLFAQTADQEIVSVVDSPDPVTPGSTLTYSITLTNHGPDPAVNGGVNMVFANEVTYVNTILPAGFSCSQFGQNVTCATPSLAVGTYTFTATVTVASSLINFADGNFTSIFYPSGTTTDSNTGNNQKNIMTSYDSPQINMGIAVSDAPDPVTPNNDITYTVNISNTGPDAGTNAMFNTFNNGSLRYQSITIPSGWSCPSLPSVGSAPTFTCTKPSYASGETAQFLLVVRADPAILGINDGTVGTAFSISATGNDTSSGNNSETENTAYVTPDANLVISVSDSPDPVTPNNDITYTVMVMNNGPDTATNVNLNAFNNGSLRYQSITIPAGWNCPSQPSVGSAPTFTCTNPSFANGASSTFTVVVRADPAILGINDGTVSTNFNVASSNVADPAGANNSETEDTAYITPDANLGVTASDSPDPVTPGNNITYSGSVTNAGPDTATSTTLTIPLDANLRFQSLTGPAGFTCGTPSVGANGTITCTNASFANGGNVPFTLVAQVDSALLSGADGTINQNFVIGSNNVTDPVSANNTITVVTSYLTPDADLSVTNADSPDPVNPGGTITYAQSITNGGPDAATNVTFSQTLPPSVGFQSLTPAAGWSCTTPAVGASGLINCTKPSLASGANDPFTLTVNVIASSGTVTDTVIAGSGTHDPDNLDNSAQAVTTITAAASADLSVGVNTGTTNAPIGSTYQYTITVMNNGPDGASNVVMTDILPSSLLFRGITEPSGFTCTTPATGATGTISCTAATLPAGTTRTFTLTVEVAPGASGPISNGAGVMSSTNDPNSGNSNGSGGVVAAGAAVADVTIAKTTATTAAPPGGTFSYTLTVTNNGPSPATNVIVTDTLPASLQFVSATLSQGTCNNANPLSCNLGTLAVNASATITLNVLVVGTSGTITNTANVSATEDAGGGSSTATPVAITAVGGDAAGAPTLSEWGLIAMGVMLAMIALMKMR
ncbi:MAG TPA: IPTL-CTERM sorting domain-containing protein [Thermoanaerobaculia bacterium]|nr:IPTL-CTERM sorting domain-containing protein [Thermoanaerobaculia bacterium]